MNGPVLVILPHNPGDVVMALQAVRRIKADFPGLEVDYLAGEECRDLVVGSPLIRRALILPTRALREHWMAGDDAGVMSRLDSFLGELGSTRYRLSANLFQERSGALIQAFVQADEKIGLELVDGAAFSVSSRYLEHLFAIPADRGSNGWHVVDIYARAIARALDRSDPENTQVRPSLPAHRAENARTLLPPLLRPEACRSLIPGEYLVFHPGSAWAGKRWPHPHWADLAARCVRAGFTVAFTGAPEERPLMDRIASGLDAAARARVIDCVGTTSLGGAAWICAHARMVITGDTVAMHLAAAAGIQTLSLFGASNPVETGPYGKGHVVIQTDPNPLPDLALEKEHDGLAHLRAEEVAEYLLEGIPPPGFPIWETGWDEKRRMQILSDAQRRLHPCLQRGAGLMRALEDRADQVDRNDRVDRTDRVDRNDRADRDGAPGALLRPGDPRDGLRAALEKSLTAPDGEDLSVLEAMERELAGETQASLIWEAYRIACNGFPLGDLRAHLDARKRRFNQALREEAMTRPR